MSDPHLPVLLIPKKMPCSHLTKDNMASSSTCLLKTMAQCVEFKIWTFVEWKTNRVQSFCKSGNSQCFSFTRWTECPVELCRLTWACEGDGRTQTHCCHKTCCLSLSVSEDHQHLHMWNLKGRTKLVLSLDSENDNNNLSR